VEATVNRDICIVTAMVAENVLVSLVIIL